jgi:hypothetical protein
MFGRIERQGTDIRTTPPDCNSGFDTADTPFAKGHVMALELGGCDQSFNIVPQYEAWQSYGEWRKMETAVHADHALQSLVIRLTYDHHGTAATYLLEKQQFAAGPDRLFAWTDSRIPTRFEVWALPTANPGGYFALADDNARAHAADAICSGLGARYRDFTIVAMPDEDRLTWRRRQVRAYVRARHEVHKTTVQASREASAQKLLDHSHGLGPTGGIKKASAARPKRLTSRQAHGEAAAKHPLLDLGPWVVQEQATLAAAVLADAGACAGWTAAERHHFTGASLLAYACG